MRYQRQLWMKSISQEGQRKIENASVLVVGAGGLGSPILYYLATAGVGHIGVIDDDSVSISNLNRQILYTTHDLDQQKTSIAKQRILALNPDIKLDAYPERLNHQNASFVFSKYSIIIDASDNYPTRYLINDTCVHLQLPLFFSSVSSWSGIFFAWIPGRNHACFRCCYPLPLPEEEALKEKQSGIVGATAGLVGSLLCTQLIQYICQDSFGFEGKMVWMDLEKGSFYTYASTMRPQCLCEAISIT